MYLSKITNDDHFEYNYFSFVALATLLYKKCSFHWPAEPKSSLLMIYGKAILMVLCQHVE